MREKAINNMGRIEDAMIKHCITDETELARLDESIGDASYLTTVLALPSIDKKKAGKS